jgi:hypothetical protein
MKLWIEGDKEALQEVKDWFQSQNDYSDYEYHKSGCYHNFDIFDEEVAIAFRLAFDAGLGFRQDLEGEMSDIMAEEIQKAIDEEIMQSLRALVQPKDLVQPKVNQPNISVIKTAVKSAAHKPMTLTAKWYTDKNKFWIK